MISQYLASSEMGPMHSCVLKYNTGTESGGGSTTMAGGFTEERERIHYTHIQDTFPIELGLLMRYDNKMKVLKIKSYFSGTCQSSHSIYTSRFLKIYIYF